MIILVNDNNILDIDFIETATAYESDRATHQKSVLPNATTHDIDLPGDFELGKYKYINGEFVLNVPAAEIEDKRAKLIDKIDTDIDAIITNVIGRRETEYLEAEKQAAAYIAANYTGAVPAFVQDWATVKNQTPTWAANSIAETAAGWRSAQAMMRASRLQHKEDARNAADIAALNGVAVSWAGFVAAIKSQLEIG